MANTNHSFDHTDVSVWVRLVNHQLKQIDNFKRCLFWYIEEKLFFITIILNWMGKKVTQANRVLLNHIWALMQFATTFSPGLSLSEVGFSHYHNACSPM